MFKQQKYLFIKFMLNLQIYLALILIFIVFSTTIFSIYLNSKLIFNCTVSKLEEIPNYLNTHSVVSYLNILELLLVIVFQLLWIYLVVLSYKKALTKMVFKKYKKIIISTKLKRISWLKSTIYCLCDGIVSSIILQIMLRIYENNKIILLITNWFLLWIITEYFLLNKFNSKYLTIYSK